MLYMVGKIFLYGLSFDIVYNESVHDNMNKLENRVFFHRVQKKISIFFKPDMSMYETVLCHHTHI